MKHIHFLLVLFFVLGCQTTRKITTDETCGSSRNPAVSAGQCSAVFAEVQSFKKPTAKDIESFFKDIEQEFEHTQWDMLVLIENTYSSRNASRSFVEHSYDGSALNKPLKSVTSGEILAERKAKSDSTTKILTELGYRVTAGHLMPPRNLVKLYEKIYEKLYISAKESGVAESDIILPSFYFSKNDSQTRKTEYQFVRPGIDPVPKKKDGWQMDLTDGEFDAAIFSRMIHERKFSLSPRMLFHDMGHIVDFIERPHYMRAYRLFIEKKNAVLTNGEIPRSVVPHLMGQVGVRGDIERYMNEWLYLPLAKNLDKIQQIIPAVQTTTFNALPNVQAFYKNKSSKELLRTAKSYLKNRYVLFSSHGGGARDWSVERRLTAHYVLKGFEETLANEGKAVDPQTLNRTEFEYKQNTDSAYQMHEAPGIFQRLEYLVAMKEGKTLPRVIEGGLQSQANSAGKDIQRYVDLLLAYHLAEVEFRVQTGLVFKMTPEKIATDTALLYERGGWEKYHNTDTFKFYSTYRSYTVQWVLGYDVARPSPNHPFIEWPGR